MINIIFVAQNSKYLYSNPRHYSNAMVIEDYNSLSVSEQWDELWEYGNRITVVDTYRVKHSLYSLHGFYVDVLSDAITNKALENNAFIDGKRMEKYIDDFDVNF